MSLTHPLPVADSRPNRVSTGNTVVVHGLRKAFGQREVLHGLDFTIPPGQFVAIVGRSGCGKSTLLRLLAGLDEATDGRIEVDGERLHDIRATTRLMFQDPRLLPWLSVGENVILGLPRTGRAAGELVLQRVGLRDRIHDWPHVLSGGQRQRVALARALAGEPQLLLLDEPLGALDALTRGEMQQLLEQLWQEHRFTALLVTHDVEEAVALADRVIVLEAGQIIRDVSIELPRPRRRTDSRFAEIEENLRNAVLQKVDEEAR